jgi:hypothetical protein
MFGFYHHNVTRRRPDGENCIETISLARRHRLGNNVCWRDEKGHFHRYAHLTGASVGLKIGDKVIGGESASEGC